MPTRPREVTTSSALAVAGAGLGRHSQRHQPDGRRQTGCTLWPLSPEASRTRQGAGPQTCPEGAAGPGRPFPRTPDPSPDTHWGPGSRGLGDRETGRMWLLIPLARAVLLLRGHCQLPSPRRCWFPRASPHPMPTTVMVPVLTAAVMMEIVPDITEHPPRDPHVTPPCDPNA